MLKYEFNLTGILSDVKYVPQMLVEVSKMAKATVEYKNDNFYMIVIGDDVDDMVDVLDHVLGCDDRLYGPEFFKEEII